MDATQPTSWEPHSRAIQTVPSYTATSVVQASNLPPSFSGNTLVQQPSYSVSLPRENVWCDVLYARGEPGLTLLDADMHRRASPDVSADAWSACEGPFLPA